MKQFKPKEENPMTFCQIAPGDVFQLSDESIWKLIEIPGVERRGMLPLSNPEGRAGGHIEYSLPYDNTPVYNVNKFYLIYEEDLPK